MEISFDDFEKPQSYHILSHSIIPRPVAWVLTENRNRSLNLAPFSYFQAIGSNPPTVMISIGRKPGGESKDTALNISEGRPFVIHLANTKLAPQVTLSSKMIEYDESEVSLCELNTTCIKDWPIPRLSAAPVAFLASLDRIVEIAGMQVVFARLHRGWFNDDILTDNAVPTPDPGKLDPLARLGFTSYAGLGSIFDVPRP